FEGEIMHRDTLGTEQRVTPGSVGWMTAGKGIVHTERTPEDWRNGDSYTVHGYQIWVALPKELEQMDPAFSHTPADDLPKWSKGPLDFILVAGKGFGHQSPVPVHSELFMVDVQCSSSARLDIQGQLKGEIGIVVVSGYIKACGERIEAGQMLVSKEEDACQLTLGPDTHLLLFGGQAFPEKRHIYWNFVASEEATIEEAKERWDKRAFDMVPGETGYIPLPGK
ncbi:MAG: pirin-like C-terminal cupin domain-containing protein, partial [Bacteroidota bacterium]